MHDVVQLRDFERNPSVPLERSGCHVVPLKVRAPEADIDRLCREAESICQDALRQSLIMYCEMLMCSLARVEAGIARVLEICAAEQAKQDALRSYRLDSDPGFPPSAA